MNIFRPFILLSLLAGYFPLAALAAGVDIKIRGVDDELRENINTSPALLTLQASDEVSAWRLRTLRDEIRTQTVAALKPFGYYQPTVNVVLTEPASSADDWVVTVQVEAGPATLVRDADIRLSGPGAEQPALQQWLQDWPLPQGQRLLQPDYTRAKQALPRLARSLGYVNGRYTATRIRVDVPSNQADIQLHYVTGERALFGGIEFGEVPLRQKVLNRFMQFSPGDPYLDSAVDQLRSDLAASGFFSTVDIVEKVDRQSEPPVISLNVKLELRQPNTYHAGIGFGTDTGPRFQAGWDIHKLNTHGDSLALGFGAQQADQEFFLRADYLRPRGDNAGDYYFASASLQRQDDDFEFEDTDTGVDIFPRLDGDRFSQLATFGLINQSRLGGHSGWLLERRYFLSFLNENYDALGGSLGLEQQALLDANPGLLPLLETDQQLVTAGVSFDLQNIRGTGFDIRGTRAHLRVLGSLEGAGSDTSFMQGYFGVNHQLRLGERSKLLLSGELGYTEVGTTNLQLMLGDQSLDFSLTDLPERYRFQAGGDASVRGYGFESLSNNRNGSNHLLTGKVEYEYLVGRNWSIAAFTDAGNAFNDVGNPDLRIGVGLGVRFYTVVGPVRLDIASALNDNGSPLRLHLTIGSPLFNFGSLPFLGGP